MPPYFHFQRLIRKYSKSFTAVIPADGVYGDNGDYIKGEPRCVSLVGAILSHRQNKIFRSEGTLTAQDRALFMLQPLEKELKGALVEYEGNVYRIEASLDNSHFTGVWAYTLKFQSAFNKGVGA